MQLPRRLKLWLVLSLIAAPLGVGAIVLSATCIAVHGSSAGAAPPASLPVTTVPASAAARAVLSESSVPLTVPTAVLPTENQLFVWPADGYVSQGMTPRHPTGIDIAAGVGSEIRAARDGTVYFVGGDPCCSYGNYIVIAHDQGWSTVYGHLSKFLVKAGDQVNQGQVIALSGDTGYVTGPHLHFEIRQNGRPVNPLDYLLPARFVEVDNGPPPRLAAAPPVVSQEEAAPTAVLSTDLSAADATVLGIAWMANNQEAAYTIEPSTCYAIQYSVNWLVTCKGQLDGCTRAGTCETYLSACVFEQPRLVTRFCPP
jgi:biotin carboxyl carrier protein